MACGLVSSYWDKGMKPIVAFLLAALMTLAVSGPVWAQGEPADDVFSMVDRAQVQVEQLLQDLGKGANGAQIYSEASTALVYLLTVEEQLKALDSVQWGKVREHAVLLEAQAEAAGVQIETELVLVEPALPALLGGDTATHDRLVKQVTLELAQQVDVVVLAQASMARVLDVISQAKLRVPILSSPHLALAQVRSLLEHDSP